MVQSYVLYPGLGLFDQTVSDRPNLVAAPLRGIQRINFAWAILFTSLEAEKAKKQLRNQSNHPEDKRP